MAAFRKFNPRVSVFGYPVGGDRLSVTEGIVSRIDFLTYTHSLVDTHLAIQIDAAINPGNSGGPVLQRGKVVGVAFQGYSGDVAQNVGYMIPVPVIQRFLKDISDGHYDRYMDLSIATFPLQNPAMRRALGLADDEQGVMVSSVASAGCSAGILKQGDVLMSIDGHQIASDAFVELDGARVQMAEVVERKFKGDDVHLHIFRDRKEMDVTVKLDAAWPYGLQANAYDVSPRYVLFGGLLFQPLNRNLLEADDIEDLRVRYFFDSFISNEIYRDHPEVIVISAILSDPINTYFSDFKNGIVDRINGTKIKTLDDMANELRKPAAQYVIDLLHEGRPHRAGKLRRRGGAGAHPAALQRGERPESTRMNFRFFSGFVTALALGAAACLAATRACSRPGIAPGSASAPPARPPAAATPEQGCLRGAGECDRPVLGFLPSLEQAQPFLAPRARRGAGRRRGAGHGGADRERQLRGTGTGGERRENPGDRGGGRLRGGSGVAEAGQRGFSERHQAARRSAMPRSGITSPIWQLETTGALLSTDALVTTVEVGRYPVEDVSLLTYRLTSSLQYREGQLHGAGGA